MRLLPSHLLVLLLLAPVVLTAQTPEADLEALNALFDGSVRFKIDKQDRLVADFFDAGGHYRQDVVHVEFLDPEAFVFVAEERTVMLRCKEAHAQCIDKEIFKHNTIRHTGRSTLPLPPGDPDGSKAIAALRALVNDAQARSAALETK